MRARPTGAAVLALLAAIASSSAAADEPAPFPIPRGFHSDPVQAKAHGKELFITDSSVVMTFGREPLLSIDDVDGLLRAGMAGPGGLVAHAHDYVSLGGVRALRLQLDYRADGRDYRRVDYLIPIRQQTNELSFTVDRAASDAQLARFDAIARSTPGLPPPERSTAWYIFQSLYIFAVAFGLLAFRARWRKSRSS